MKNKIFKDIGLFLLAVIFSVGLMFAFIELPKLLDELLQTMVGTPQGDPAYQPERIELFYQAYEIRLIGYVCIGLVLLFIILGFATRKTGWAWMGSLVLFLPVFATFAHSMFYLAGLGLLNVVIFPVQDISLSLVNLGQVVLVPYWILMWIFRQFDWYAHNFLSYFFMVTGALVFVLGVFAWVQTRYNNLKVARHWIYRYSRHPQYLGWIIWSYGLMLYGPTLNQMKKSWGWTGTLPWLLSTLIIIGICLLEELKMRERAGSEYENYKGKTPFLFPLPGIFKKIIIAPIRWIIRKDKIESTKDIAVSMGLYATIFMVLSIFWMDLSPSDQEIERIYIPYSQERTDSIVAEIRESQVRRYRSLDQFGDLLAMGEKTYPYLIDLTKDPDHDVREFAVLAISYYKIEEAIPALITALNDPEFRIVKTAVRGLGELKAVQAKDSLLYLLENPLVGVDQYRILEALSNMGSIEIIPYLEEKLKDSLWYHTTSALRSMIRLDFEIARPYLYKALEDNRHRVRREAVYILLEILPDDAIPYLEKVTNDEHWDVRFYSRQAIRLIREKKEK